MNQEHNREKREAVAMFTRVRSTLRRIAVSALLLSATFGASAQVRYVHTDGLGSVVVMTDQNRNVIERREYEPYGSTLAPAKDGPGFTGHVSDAQTGLTYMQQRYYDPQLGVFLSVDPVTAYDNPVTQFHRYRYANNNPYSFTDPDGRESGPIRAMERDHRAYLSGKMSQQELTANRNARGIGAAVGAVLAAGGIGAAKLGAVALANPATANSVATAILEVGAGDALGGATLATGVVLTARQTANLARFERSMPAGNTGVAVDSLGDGVVFTSTVPGNVPGSQAVYQKTVDSAGDTSSLLKTTTNPHGDVVHIKDKINNTELPKY